MTDNMLNEIAVKYKKTTHRSIPPEKTLKNISNITTSIGLTRTSNITHLDRLNIPVFTSIRPMAREGAVSVYAGKGPTELHAKVSSIMEAVERYSAEQQDDDESIVKSYDNTCINPENLILPSNSHYTINDEIEWVIGKSLSSDEEVYIPANAVYHPYNSTNKHLFLSNTNGLASGNKLEEAIFHGMMEVVERDAWSFFEAYKKTMPEVSCENTTNEYIQELLKKFEDSNVYIKLIDMTSDNDIPTIGAVSEDLIYKDPALLTVGIGTHLNPEIAAIRAITEVAQSRATQIHGTREDATRADLLKDMDYNRMKRINKHWFNQSDEKIELNEIEDKSTDSFKKDIELTLDLLKKTGIDDAYYVDLTRDINIPVVRVIIPSMEVFSVDSSRLGERLKPDFLI